MSRELQPGQVVLVRFPFSSLDSSKKRPALVLKVTAMASRSQLITLAMVTSQVDGVRLEGDVLLSDWKEAGLLHPSLVRLAKVATLDPILITGKLGGLSAADTEEVRRAFRKVFKSWI